MRKVSGFTIIELVVVITILGILAAVALPRFFDLQDDARRAAAQGAAGAVSSGAALNYGSWLAKGSTIAPAGPTAVNACTTAILGAILTGPWPTDITVADGTAGSVLSAGLTDGASGQCFFGHAGNAAIVVTASIIKVD